MASDVASSAVGTVIEVRGNHIVVSLDRPEGFGVHIYVEDAMARNLSVGDRVAVGAVKVIRRVD